MSEGPGLKQVYKTGGDTSLIELLQPNTRVWVDDRGPETIEGTFQGVFLDDLGKVAIIRARKGYNMKVPLRETTAGPYTIFAMEKR